MTALASLARGGAVDADALDSLSSRAALDLTTAAQAAELPEDLSRDIAAQGELLGKILADASVVTTWDGPIVLSPGPGRAPSAAPGEADASGGASLTHRYDSEADQVRASASRARLATVSRASDKIAGGEGDDTMRSPDDLMKPDSVDAAEAILWGLLKAARLAGLKFAPDMLERFLTKAGDIEIPRDELRAVKAFADMEERLRSYVEEVLQGNATQTSSPWIQHLNRISESREFKNQEDSFTALYKPGKDANSATDINYAFGNTSLNSRVILSARLEGSTISFHGTATYDLTDPYDFAPGNFLADLALSVERSGRTRR